ncbi:GntR family transcriptional regulator [Actinomycetospora endophytica]|uniref:GntR family transcriptional regulator n=1 Tax=Actinomycetospora endophytica TaxID=2291215 RepID=A0ABS8PF57_9PSEU|nr:GntR family transcriptional regulator [Actinomycetospora endophytica]MCD2196887.1 GntR family transcriptional regulator [Actinomycetospora endophytica]
MSARDVTAAAPSPLPRADRATAPESGARSVAYRRIRDDIVEGSLPPGRWVREGPLADQLGVSRTPVREALNALAAEGLVEIVRHRGARVCSWTVRDVDEVYRLRAMLEGEGARLAVTRADTAALRALRDQDRRFERAATELSGLRAAGHGGSEAADAALSDAVEANGALHRGVLEAADSPRLLALLSSLSSSPRVRQAFHHYTDADLARSISGHHDIVLGIERGDEALAESAMRSHILGARHAAARSASDADL